MTQVSDKDKREAVEGAPDNLYDGAILLLQSWAACMGNRPSDWQQIAANLLTDTQALLRDEAARESDCWNTRAPTVAPCPWCKAIPIPHATEEGMMVIHHAPECYLALDGPMDVLDEEAVAAWFARADLTHSVPQEWQPIATAPRDATPILVGLISDGRVWRASDAKFYGVGFYTVHGGNSCHWATHWMPLPSVPQSKDVREER